MLLTSCPSPEGRATLSVLLTSGAVNPEKALPKGQEPVAAAGLLRIDATIQSLRLLSADGLGTVATPVYTGPVTLNLLDLVSLATLLSTAEIPEGSYTGAELVITAASMVLADAPNDVKPLALQNNGRYSAGLVFDAVAGNTRLILIDLGGLDVLRLENGDYLLDFDVTAALRDSVAGVRLEGVVENIDPAARTLELASGTATYTVDFRASQIFLPGDFMTASGAPGDLAAQSRIAATGSFGIENTMAPQRIEIIDDPATPEDDAGDHVAVCLLYGDSPRMAATVTVSRAGLQAVLDRGGFAGPCEEGAPFTLTYEAGPGGTIDGASPQSVAPGADGTAVLAAAGEGFTFSAWSDGRTDNPRTDLDVGSDITVMAHFTELVTLSYTAGAGGTLSGNVNQAIPLGGDGSPVTAIRDDGYVFSRWSDGRTDNPRTDRGVMEDLSVSAEFLERFIFTYSAGPGGMVDGVTMQTVASGAAGSPVTAVADEGFEFVDWSDGSTDNPRTDLNAAADITVTANFARLYTLSYAAGPNGSVTGEAVQIVIEGGQGEPVTAVPDEDFGFAGWSDGRFDNPRADAEVTSDVSVTATFAPAVTLRYSAGPNGSIDGPALQVIGEGGGGAPVTAVPGPGFGFSEWSDGRLDNPRTDTGVTEDLDVTASFVQAFMVRYIAGANGSLSGEAEQLVNISADGTAVTAVPAEGFGFSMWSDGRTDNPRTDTEVSQDITVTASFLPVFALSYTVGENGAIEGPAAQSVIQGSDGQPVTAVGNDGFGFRDWSDGRTDNPRTDLNVMADVDVTANFGPIILLTYAAAENGALTGSTAQQVLPGDDGTPVTAVPDEGYLFLQWDDGSTDNPRMELAPESDVNVTATFFKAVEMLPVPGGAFLMGASGVGDDLQFGSNREKPQHEVTLSPYEIGKYEITNTDYAAFLNYMHHPSRSLLRDLEDDVRWSGGRIMFRDTDDPQAIFRSELGEDGLEFVGGQFVPKVTAGIPEGTTYERGEHPVSGPTWYGSVLYCNWLSERAGLEPVYDLDSWEADFTRNGYRLPTEAEWERAAAWDGEKHWIYAITDDELEGRLDRVNYRYDRGNGGSVNPLGFVEDGTEALTSPVGWFNGINISPKGNIQTVDSKSPIGAYDMSGNIREWCHDYYSLTYYAESPNHNPTGPESGENRIQRGGSWTRSNFHQNQRTAVRFDYEPGWSEGHIGFRIARGVHLPPEEPE